jgi:hypothetical protein
MNRQGARVSSSDDDRIAYLSGEDVASLNAHERAELDELRTLLESPATWAEPDPALEDRVSGAIAAEARDRGADASALSPERGTRQRRRMPALPPRFPRPRLRWRRWQSRWPRH